MFLSASQTIVFVGDSITHAHRRPDEFHDCYRLGSGYVNYIAGEVNANDLTAGYRIINSGECGDTTQHLLARWERDCLAHRPNLVSILIGINDVRLPEPDAAHFRSNYRQILDRTKQRLPSAKLVLMEPFGVRVAPHPSIETISEQQLERLEVLRPILHELAAATGAVFVPLQELFQEPPATSWTLDGIHPSAAGHYRIAQAWLAATRAAGWFRHQSQESDGT